MAELNRSGYLLYTFCACVETRVAHQHLGVPAKAVILCPLKNAMKNLFLPALFAIVSATASAQNKQAVDSNATPVGLPVLKSYVAPDVVERARKKYGRLLYSIEKSTAANCQDSYLVGLIRNRRLTMEWMCDDPKLVWRLREAGFAKQLCLVYGRKTIQRFIPAEDLNFNASPFSNPV